MRTYCKHSHGAASHPPPPQGCPIGFLAELPYPKETSGDSGLYKEELPPKCPPAEASGQDFDVLFRFVTQDPPTGEDFSSHMALGKPCPPNQDPCRWSSCSLFTERRYDLLKLPKLRARAKFFALVEVAASAGVSILKGNHVDLWMYAGFDPLAVIIGVEAVDG